MTRILSSASITLVIPLPVSLLLGESSLQHYWWVVWAFSRWHRGWKRGLWALVSVVSSCFCGRLMFLWSALISVASSCFCYGLLFLLKTRIDSVVEIEKLILQADEASRLTPTCASTCNGMKHLIICFIGFSLATKRANGFIAGSRFSPCPVVYVTKPAKSMKKAVNIIYGIIAYFSEVSSDSTFSSPEPGRSST